MKTEIITILIVISVAFFIFARIENEETDKILKTSGIRSNQNPTESSGKQSQSLGATKKEKYEITEAVKELNNGKSLWELIENEKFVVNMSIGNLLDSETGKAIEEKTSILSISCNKLNGTLGTMLIINGFTPAIDSEGNATVVYTTNIDGSDVKEAQGWANGTSTGNKNLIGTNSSKYALELLNKDLVTFGTKVNNGKFILTSFSLNGYDKTVEPVLTACKVQHNIQKKIR